MALAFIGEVAPTTAACRFPGAKMFALDLASSPTVAAGDTLRIYVDCVKEGEMREIVGWQEYDGTNVDGALTDFLQSIGASVDLDLSTTATAVDQDSGSPNYGRVYVGIDFRTVA